MVWLWVALAFFGGTIFGIIVIAVCAANDAYIHGKSYWDKKKGE